MTCVLCRGTGLLTFTPAKPGEDGGIDRAPSEQRPCPLGCLPPNGSAGNDRIVPQKLPAGLSHKPGKLKPAAAQKATPPDYVALPEKPKSGTPASRIKAWHGLK